MSLDLGTLTGFLALDNSKWDAALGKSKDDAQDFGVKVPGWMTAASVGIVAAMAAAGVGLFKLGQSFDDVGDTIQIATGATGDQLDGLVESAKKVGAQVPVEYGKIGPAIASVSQRMGLSGDLLEKVASQFLNAGDMLGQDVDINAASGALALFKISGDEVSGSLDDLFRISQSTGIGLNDLIAQVQSAGPITQQLGFSFLDTAGMIGTMDKAGLDSQTMIGAMQRGLINLASPGESAQDAFHRVTDQIQGYIDTGNNAAAIDLAGQVFGTRGAAQFIGALQTGKLNMDDLTAGIALNGDGINATAAKTADFGETWQKFVNKMMAEFEPIGSRVFSMMSQGLKTVTDLSGPAFKWINENIPLLKNVALAVGTFSAAFVVLTTAVKAYNVIAGIIKVSTSAWAAVQGILNLVMAANPVGLIVLGIAALIAIIVLLVANWDSVVKFLTGIWQGFVDFIGQVWDNIVGFFQDAIANVISFVQNNWGLLLSFLIGPIGLAIQWIVEHWGEIVKGIKAGWDAVMAFFAGIPGAIASFFAGIGQWLLDAGHNLLVGLATGIALGFIALKYLFTQFPTDLLNWLVGAAIWLVQTGQDLLAGLGAGIAAGWNAVVAFFTGLPDMIWQAIIAVDTWLLQTGIDLLNGLAAGISAGWSAVVAWFTALPGAIWAMLVGAALWLNQTGTDILTGLVAGITAGWNGVVGFFTAMPGKVVSFLLGAGSWLVSTGSNLISGLLNGVQSMWQGFLGFLRGIPGAVVGFFSGIGSWLFNAGKDLINGLLNGIKSLAGTIGNFFLGLLPSWIVGPFKAALGIHSPSTVFAGFGRNIAQGIVVGLDAEQDALNSRVGDLVSVPASMAATLALSAAGGAGSGNRTATSTLTINGNVGWDAEEVARQTAERQRQASALAGINDLVGVA